ncbi:DNA polymerase delta subunit 4 isoform X2 [Larimichthys crocea]|uniref:DNA polymerase delta subunit 4 isoform X2 n=1 Tax=Larimichthys crocea TaxID=215358 RepID=UPI000901F7E2|nr:DNA polymerase delta subunit 4 isoform X2 [Larimichthys crocea]
MTTKHGLITDSFKVVKKARRGAGRKKRSSPPPPQKGTGSQPLEQALNHGQRPRQISSLWFSESETGTVREEELQKHKQFDLDWRFGPCTGISRLQRWERAKLHGLNPPEEIRDLLSQAHTDAEYNQSLWSGYPL